MSEDSAAPRDRELRERQADDRAAGRRASARRRLVFAVGAALLVGQVWLRPGIPSVSLLLAGLLVMASGSLSTGSPDNSSGETRRFLRGMFAVLLIGLALVAGLNLIVNPFRLYPPRLIDSDILLTSRRDKLELYRVQDPPPQVVIFGSSRSFTLSPADLESRTGLRGFNASVQGGSPRDYLAFLRMILRSGDTPGYVLVGLSPEQFFWHGIEDVIEPAEPLAEYMPSSGGALLGLLRAVKMLVSSDQLSATIKVLDSLDEERALPYYSFEQDGLGVFNHKVPLERAIREYLAGPWAPQVFDIQDLDPVPIAQLRAFLDLCQQNGIEVIVFLPPFHPQAVARYREESNFPYLLARTLDVLESLSAEYSFPLYYFPDPASFGGTDQMFNDAVHPNREAYQRMLDIMAKSFH